MKLQEISDKKVVILGLAREGMALARFLAQRGVQVTVSDCKGVDALQKAVAELADLPIRFALGGHPLELLNDADAVFVSPGVPLDIPFLLEARSRSIPLSSETRLFAQNCPAPVIGITGSNGKTTTVTLVGEMLKNTGWRTHVGGNIGQPLIGLLDEVQPSDRVVMELSSFQLELFGTRYGESGGWSPHIAAILNVTPNHLDRHKTMEAYRAAKEQIVLYQRVEDYTVLSWDDHIAREIRAKCHGHILGFSVSEELSEGAFLRGERLMLRLDGREYYICQRSELRLLGTHNVANVLAACAIAGLAGGEIEAMREVARRFRGVAHRLEFVREHRGVYYYNDSIATSPERSAAAMRSFDAPLLLLAGGRDKDLPWDEWADLVAERVKHLIVFGEAQPLIARAVSEARARHGLSPDDTPHVHLVDTMERAVERAATLAQTGEVVLLSPGATSFDAYRDFAERGERFRDLVWSLS